MVRWKVQSDYARHGCEVSVKVGDLIYDSHYGQHGLVIEVSETEKFCTVFYEDGDVDRGIRPREIEVVNESR